MADLAMDIAKLVEILPESDQRFAYEFVKKLVLAWDPDFTKVTKAEAERIARAEQEEFIPEDQIDWDDLGKYTK